MAHVYRDFDVFTEYNVDEYLSSIGLVVADGYRGLGIGKEILRAR